MSDGATTWSCAIADCGVANVMVKSNANKIPNKDEMTFFIFPPRKIHLGGLAKSVYRETFGSVNGFKCVGLPHFDIKILSTWPKLDTVIFQQPLRHWILAESGRPIPA